MAGDCVQGSDILFSDFEELEITDEQLESILFIEISLNAFLLLTLLTRTISLSRVYLAPC